jgi:hypothetical protein
MDYIDEFVRPSGFEKLPWVNVDCKGYKEPPPPPPPPPPPEMDHAALAAAEEAKQGERMKEKRRKGRAATRAERPPYLAVPRLTRLRPQRRRPS